MTMPVTDLIDNGDGTASTVHKIISLYDVVDEKYGVVNRHWRNLGLG